MKKAFWISKLWPLLFVFLTSCAHDYLEAPPQKVVAPASPGPSLIPNSFSVTRGAANEVGGLNVLLSGNSRLEKGALVVAHKKDGTVESLRTSTYDDGTKTIITISFIRSIPDGDYTLTLVASQIQDEQGATLVGGDQSFDFFQLRGNFNGDRVVNDADLNLFRAALGSAWGDAAYNLNMDFDENGVIDFLDFAQFRKVYGNAL